MRSLLSAAAILAAPVSLLGCAGKGAVIEPFPREAAYSPVPVIDIRVYRSVDYAALPSGTPKIMRGYKKGWEDQEALIGNLQRAAGNLGANAIVRGDTVNGLEFFAVLLATPGAITVADSIEKVALDRMNGTNSGSYAGGSSDGPVHVRGYTRKDGTYVRPHTRSRPRR